MAKFLFQPDPIDKVNFKPIAIDLHKEVIKIVNSQSYADFQLNNTESVIFGTDKEEILSRIQRGLECQFNQYGKLKKEDISALDYKTLQAWKRIQNMLYQI
jgi:hypothetical protein